MERNDCVLVSCPMSDDLGSRQPTRLESLALGYLAAYAKQQSCNVLTLDAGCLHLTFHEVISRLSEFNVCLLGISILSHDDIPLAIRLARGAKNELNVDRIVVGGIPATLSYQDIMRACSEIDAVVVGEGEKTLVSLLKNSATLWHNIPGLALRKNGSVFLSGAAEPIINLDKLPFPLRETDLPRAAGGIWSKHYQIHTSRGCPFNCSFCCIRAFEDANGSCSYRIRSVTNILEEIDLLYTKKGARFLSFNDSNFIVGKRGRERAIELASGILAMNMPISFSILIRAEEATFEVLEPLKQAGLYSVLLGIESGVQNILDELNKKTTVEENIRAIEVIQSVGVICVPGFIMYTPDCSLEDIRQNIAFLEKYNILSGECFQKLIPYPGTPIADKLLQQRRLIPGTYDAGFTGTYVYKDVRVDIFSKSIAYGRSLLKKLYDELDKLKEIVSSSFIVYTKVLSDHTSKVAQTIVIEVRALLKELLLIIINTSFLIANSNDPYIETDSKITIDKAVAAKYNFCNKRLSELRSLLSEDLDI